MVKHIVMWTLKGEMSDSEKNSALVQLKSRLEGLKGKIPQIRFLEVGINFNESDAAFDVALVTDFNTKEDLATYQAHPEHQEVAKFLKTITEKRVVVDYEW